MLIKFLSIFTKCKWGGGSPQARRRGNGVTPKTPPTPLRGATSPFVLRKNGEGLLAMPLLLLIAACSPSKSPEMKFGPDDWATTGGDAGKSHHSQLTDITAANVGALGLAWQAELGTNRVLEATPIVIDGVMYTSGVAGRAYAFDAATGKQLWAFEPDVNMQINRTVCCDMANRGVAVARGKVYVSALDSMLYALDAKTGKVLWKVDAIEDHSRGTHSTGAPEVAGDVVVIGNGGADYDARGYVSGYDLESGKLAWRFYVVPRDPKLGPQETPELEVALKTWDPNSRWDVGGGGGPWDAISYDVETGLVLVGTGNAQPYPGSIRSPKGGNNLYTSSIIALDAKTGRLKWHYQESPSEQWDYDAIRWSSTHPKTGSCTSLTAATGSCCAPTPSCGSTGPRGLIPKPASRS
jgi:quinohemoprotein ethanol dehydrogenase